MNQMGVQVIFLALVFGLVMSATLPADYLLGPSKKSTPNLNEFMSAINGASRLRYGKRAAVGYYEDEFPGFPMRMMLDKRMSQNLPELIDSLNGAERLRFGK